MGGRSPVSRHRSGLDRLPRTGPWKSTIIYTYAHTEQERLAALAGLEILDTPPEARFDRYTRIAALTFGVPTALVSLVGAERQWCKSRVGFEPQEMPRSLSLCSHAVLARELLVVEDAACDPRFAANLLVTGAPHIRFYAGQPLFSDGQAVGTLCIIDRAPRSLSDEQRQVLKDLAGLVEAELDHMKALAARMLAEQALKSLNTELESRSAARGAELQERAAEAARTGRQLEDKQELLRAITDNLPVLIAHLGPDRRYVFANAVHQSWLGKAPAQVIGQTMAEAFGEQYCLPQHEALDDAWDGKAAQCEHDIVRKKHIRIVHSTFLPQLREGKVVGVYILTTDATAARMHERNQHALAHTDSLTGIPNRRQFELALQATVQRAPQRERAFAVLNLEIDRFALISDGHGQAVADMVLVEFARRVRAAVRSSDLVARLAGEKFTVLLGEVGSPRGAELVARKILQAMESPFVVGTQAVALSASIGIGLADAPGVTAQAIAALADDALREARRGGANTLAIARLSEAPALGDAA